MPPGFVFILISFFLFILALVGYVIGSFLEKRVKGKYMIVGSAVYWTVYLVNLYLRLSYPYIYRNLAIETLSSILIFWGLLALPINITHLVKHIVRRLKLKHSDVQKYEVR